MRTPGADAAQLAHAAGSILPPRVSPTEPRTPTPGTPDLKPAETISKPRGDRLERADKRHHSQYHDHADHRDLIRPTHGTNRHTSPGPTHTSQPQHHRQRTAATTHHPRRTPRAPAREHAATRQGRAGSPLLPTLVRSHRHRHTPRTLALTHVASTGHGH